MTDHLSHIYSYVHLSFLELYLLNFTSHVVCKLYKVYNMLCDKTLFSSSYTITLLNSSGILCISLCSVPPTVTPIESQLIGVETRDGRPSKIEIRFFISRATPPVQLENITWTYVDQITMEQLDIAALASNDSKYQLSEDLRTFTISDLSFFDAGRFTFNATNEAGTGSATLQLVVHGE